MSHTHTLKHMVLIVMQPLAANIGVAAILVIISALN